MAYNTYKYIYTNQENKAINNNNIPFRTGPTEFRYFCNKK
jgi:hypothetical protein